MNEHDARRLFNLSRRQFLKLSALLAGVAAFKPRENLLAAPTLGKPKVVHVYCVRATDWDFLSGWWGDHVSPVVVKKMVDSGVMELTGRSSRAAAWQALLPDYVPGQRVAIKVNLNNAHSVGDSDNVIDAAIEPVNAVIAGLKDIGVAASDIWVYDAVRSIPTRFKDGCSYPAVHFSGDSTSNPQGFSSTQKVSFQPPPGEPALADQHISNVLVNADYLINMPLMKKHGGAWVTLSFKNHFGSIEYCAALHEYTFPYEHDYTSAYSPLVDIYKNPHFGAKTILTIGDGLFGSRGAQNSVPEPWTAFGDDSPRSLFFSQDPVAIDSVMYDFLDEEAEVRVHGDDYLPLAAQAGLGVFEHRDPGASNREEWYSQIDYRYLDIDAYVKLRGMWRDGIAYLEWNKPLHPELAGYRVCYASGTGGNVGQGSSPIDISDPDQLDIQLTGLTMYALYEFWIEPYRTGGTVLGESNRVLLMASDILQHLPLVSAG
jgi:uncharacterized protein (DUF362 family)